jgi:hypothetical protein
MPQEIQQQGRLTRRAAKVEIRDPDGAEAELAVVIVVHGDRLRIPPPATPVEDPRDSGRASPGVEAHLPCPAH